MFFIMGINTVEKKLEYNSNMRIHSCCSYERAEVHLRANVLSLFFINTLKFNREYFVKYTCCNRVYRLNKDIGKEIEKGLNVEITEADLLEEVFTGYRCSNCNNTLDRDYEFCPYCGNKR